MKDAGLGLNAQAVFSPAKNRAVVPGRVEAVDQLKYSNQLGQVFQGVVFSRLASYLRSGPLGMVARFRQSV